MAKWTSQSTQHDIAAFSGGPEIKAELRKRLRRLLIVSLTCVLVVGFSARPTYRWVRNALLDRNLAHAKAAIRLEDWGSARNLARSVLLSRPDDFEAFRVWHQALSHMGEPRTYLVATNLFVDPRASGQDRLDALKVLAQQAPQAIAFSAYASLSEKLQRDPAALAAIAPLLTQRGETAYVEKVLRGSSTLPSDPAVQLELLRALLSRPSSERVAEARTLFAGLIEIGASELALEAMRLLGESPSGLAPGFPLPPLPEWVKLQPKATTLHHLLALHPAIEANPAAAEAVFQQAVDRFLALDPGTLGTWLIRHDQIDRAAKVLELPAKTSASAFIARLHALLRQKNSAAVTAALSAPPASCDLVDLALIKVAAARLLNDSAAEIEAWNQALNGAAFDQSRNRFIELGKYAKLLGAAKIVDDAWVAAVRFGWGQIPLYRDLRGVFGSLASTSRSEDMLAMCATLLRFEPQNQELLCNYYYLALLHGIATPASIVKALETLTAANPKATDFLPALTMAYLMAEQPANALRQISVMKASNSISRQACQSLEATALLLNGDAEAGGALLKGINWSALMACESLAYRNLLNRPKFKDLPLPSFEPATPVLNDNEVPAWRKAIQRLEKDRKNDILPPLPAPKTPGHSEESLRQLPPGK